MIKLITDKQEASYESTGSSFKGYIYTTYDKLVKAIGEPTFDEPSGDEKTQVEWVIDFKGDFFTIYDWKTYDRDYTLNDLDRFNIGGKSQAFDFIEHLEKLIKSNQ